MKVVHLNTSVNKSSAPYRLHLALRQNGVDSTVLVLNEGEKLEGVYPVCKNLMYRCKRKIVTLYRKQKMMNYKVMENMPFTAIPTGMNISQHPSIKEADLICIHWIGGDYLSPHNIKQLLDLGKPVLWTCHDNYPFTGGCHVRLGCNRYQTGCGKCPQMGSGKELDISRRLIEEKLQKIVKPNLYITSPSRWMDNNVTQSVVLKNQKHFILPNTIDVSEFKPVDKVKARTKLGLNPDVFMILVGLKENENIPYNGMDFLWETLKKLSNKCENGMIYGKNIEIVVFGAQDVKEQCDLPVQNLGYIRDREKMRDTYAAADLYLVTSLEDSFNQTVAECMACGTPVVAFKNGGIEDIIDHEMNGYLAEYKDVDDMVKGILYQWDDTHRMNARTKIEKNFSCEIVSSMFIDIAIQIDKIN